MPGTVQSTLHAFSYLTLATVLWSHQAQFLDETLMAEMGRN